MCIKASQIALENMVIYTSLTLFGYTVLLFKEKHKELTVQIASDFVNVSKIQDTISKILSFKYIYRMDRSKLD